MSTMLSGAAVMDAALLLIAGNETCPQPQTSEHLGARAARGALVVKHGRRPIGESSSVRIVVPGPGPWPSLRPLRGLRRRRGWPEPG